MELRIALAGLAGVGKGKLSRELARYYESMCGLKLSIRSAGDLFRVEADRRGITLEELDRVLVDDPSVDYAIDDQTHVFAASTTNYILEGRRVALLVPEDATKILLRCTDDVRFGRIAERQGIPLEEAARLTYGRESALDERYQRYYKMGVAEHFNPARYDWVIDTSQLTVPQMVEVAAEYISQQ